MVAARRWRHNFGHHRERKHLWDGCIWLNRRVLVVAVLANTMRENPRFTVRTVHMISSWGLWLSKRDDGMDEPPVVPEKRVKLEEMTEVAYKEAEETNVLVSRMLRRRFLHLCHGGDRVMLLGVIQLLMLGSIPSSGRIRMGRWWIQVPSKFGQRLRLCSAMHWMQWDQLLDWKVWTDVCGAV